MASHITKAVARVEFIKVLLRLYACKSVCMHDVLVQVEMTVGYKRAIKSPLDFLACYLSSDTCHLKLV